MPIPLLGAAAIAGGTSILNNILNRSGMRYQQDLAQQGWREQWSEAYSPQAQARNLAAAGVNPAVAFDNGTASSAVASQAPQPSLGNFGLTGFNDLNMLASSLKSIADAKKSGVDTEAVGLENEVRRRTLEESVKRAGLENGYTATQIQHVETSIAKIEAEMNNLRTENLIKHIDLDKHSEFLDAQLRKYLDEHKLSRQNYDYLRSALPEMLGKLKSENTILDVDAIVAKDYKETAKKVGLLGDVIKIITQMLKVLK